MSRVDYCVTTMDRPQALERLLLSIAEHRRGASIHVADQSKQIDSAWHRRLAEGLLEAGLRQAPEVHPLPFDCGVSAARNHLVDSTAAEYLLFLDDDFVFTERTDVDAMARLLDADSRVGVVGGSVSVERAIRNVGTLLRERGSSLSQVAPASSYHATDGIRFREADCVPMFALMRRGLFAHVRWDPALKTAAEHFDFFLRVRSAPYAVVHTPDAVVDHPPIAAEPDYVRRRWRNQLLAQMLAKHSLTRLKTLDGTVMELCPDGELVGYCELDG